METWHIILISLCITALLKSLLTRIHPSKTKPKLPPAPPSLPIIGNFRWLRKTFFELEPTLRSLHAKYGPLITLPMGSIPAIFISSRSLAYEALVHNGAIFADRPRFVPTSRVLNNNQHNISSATYGPTWRLLRRILTSEILHPSCLKSYSGARRRVLDVLVDRLKTRYQSGEAIIVADHFQFAMCHLLVFMCFGKEIEEEKINELITVQRQMLSSIFRFNVFNVWPRMGKILFRNRWKELMELCKRQDDVMLPLIRTRMKVKREKRDKEEDEEGEKENLVSYVDTLMDLELPEEKRNLEEGDMVSLCSEFLTAGVDTTSAVLQWIMANIVKYPHIQERLWAEIEGVVGGGDELWEDDLQRMPYLKAVILEGLRRHPPGHFVVPHAVTEDAVLGGYTIPRNALVNFMVAEMGWDSEVWEDPMAFKPERFLNSDRDGDAAEEFDITGSKEIKMMPFGAGRRICPGCELAMLHLEYFVAKLVWHFEWKTADGEEVDLSETQEFAIVMKNPLRARLVPRMKKGMVADR